MVAGERGLDVSNALLLRLGDEAADHIAERLAKDTPVGSDAFRLLACHSSERALEVLKQAATNAKQRENVAMALSEEPNPKCVPVLRTLCLHDDWNTEYYACEALGSIGTKEALQVLCDLAKAENKEREFRDSIQETRVNHKRRCALEALSRLPNRELTATYDYALEHGRLTEDEVFFCLSGLGRIDDPSARPIVERILQKSQNSRNSEAAQGLLDRWKSKARTQKDGGSRGGSRKQ